MNIEILEGNKLIAEFMGWQLVEGVTWESNWQNDKKEMVGKDFSSDLLFHSSWDWLMPVVEKIESFDCKSIDCRFKIERYQCKVYYNTVNMIYDRSNIGTSKINSVWIAAIRFIKWYNLNPPKQ